MESKRNAAKTYVQEHLDELTPEMRAAVEDLLSFLTEAKIEYVDERHLKFNNLTMKTNSEHATWHNTHDFITVKCTNCGKEFQTRKANHGKHRFCCKICKNQFDSRTYRKPLREKTCVICGKIFLTRTENAKTCSRPCRHTLVGITRRERNVARKSDK